jgi:Dolichyl-phosphate-mannose-protein mannosyltransferase
MLTAAASALLIAWLPGACIYRLPLGARDRRAALPFEERGFWQVIISLAVSHAVVLSLAAVQSYSFRRLLTINLILVLVLSVAARFRLRLGAAPRPTPSILIVAALVALALPRFLPPAEYIIGGKDPGTYVNEGIVIAQRGTLVYRDPVVAAVPPFARDLFFPSHQRSDYYGTRFMGFFVRDPETGDVVGQFPHLLPASYAIGYGLDGLTGVRRVTGVWATLGIIAVYMAGVRLVGRTAAAAGAALLALNVIQVWYGRYPNAEVVMQALLFGAVLANARAHFDPDGRDGFFGATAGALLGLLLFLRFDAVLAIGAVVLGNLLAQTRGQPMSRSFICALVATMTAAGAYLFGPMRAYATYPITFVTTPNVRQIAVAAVAALVVAAFLLAARIRAPVQRRMERWLPVALIIAVWILAVYALFLRKPEGKLALENAYALRFYAGFYVTVPCLVAALAGYAVITRRKFWHDPALVITITLFSVFFFYKPRIYAEHFWAARRYLPVILPATLLLACSAATWGLMQRSRWRRVLSGAVGFVFIGLLAAQYARASSAIAGHVEYAGVIAHIEQLVARIGDRDLLIVESRDAGSEAHVFALPLAYIYARDTLVLSSAAPDTSTFATFLEWARTRYDNVYFLGGGGTALVSTAWSASPLWSERFEVPEYESTFNSYPRAARQKKFDFGLYVLLPPSGRPDPTIDLDVGVHDDLHVVRFHGKENASGRTMRWSQDQSFVFLKTIPARAREVVLTMSSGGRPDSAPPAAVSVYLDERPLGAATVADGFHPYVFPLPAHTVDSATADSPPRLILRSSVWNPSHLLGGPDDRELGVMVDRVQVR